MTVNLKLLRSFEAVARHMSFRKAASELHRSESTLSIQVRELEDQLGVRLLLRTTRRLDLTEPGARLFASVERAFRELDEGLAAVRDLADARRRRIQLACVPSISSSRLPNLLAGFLAKQPDIRVDVKELTSNEIPEALSSNRVDIALGPRIDAPDIAFTSIVIDPICALTGGEPDADMPGQVTMEELARLPLLTLSGSVQLQRTLEEAAMSQGLELHSCSEVQQVQTAIAMARAGLGVAIVPFSAIPADIGPAVGVASIISPALTRDLGLMTRNGEAMPPDVAKLAHHLRWALRL